MADALGHDNGAPTSPGSESSSHTGVEEVNKSSVDCDLYFSKFVVTEVASLVMQTWRQIFYGA